MQLVKITYANGDSITTRFNGTAEDIRDHYLVGALASIGRVVDNWQRIISVESLGEAAMSVSSTDLREGVTQKCTEAN